MKKKIFGITLAVALVVLSIAGTSLAYFSDTETATNTFTSGDGIKITLKYNGTDVDDETPTSVLKVKDENVFPAQTFTRNATIENIGSGDAYVGAIITISNDTNNIKDIITAANIKLLFPEIAANGHEVRVALDATNNTYTVYVVKTTELAQNGTDVFLENITIPAAWGNTEMAAFSGTKITVTAYAVQTVGFDGANAALTTAFEPAWKNFATASALS